MDPLTPSWAGVIKTGPQGAVLHWSMVNPDPDAEAPAAAHRRSASLAFGIDFRPGASARSAQRPKPPAPAPGSFRPHQLAGDPTPAVLLSRPPQRLPAFKSRRGDQPIVLAQQLPFPPLES